MTDRPIIFSAPMVRALMEGRKTQTRRIIKPDWNAGANKDFSGWWASRITTRRWQIIGGMDVGAIVETPYTIGDRLWVREAFNQFWFSQDGDDAWPSCSLVGPAGVREIAEDGCRVSPPQLVYRESDRARKWFSGQPWRPSIYMPRWASRLTLIVTDIRVQRLQEISGEDCAAEGVCEFALMPPTDADAAEARGMFRDLWNSLYGHDPWDANPWVAAITFRTIRSNIDSAEAEA